MGIRRICCIVVLEGTIRIAIYHLTATRHVPKISIVGAECLSQGPLNFLGGGPPVILKKNLTNRIRNKNT